MSTTETRFDTGILIRRFLFFLVLLTLTFGNLFTLFRGLNSPHAMDQAQIAREIARGNGFTTKFIRPMAYQQAMEHNKAPVPFTGFKDTYHSPLNPLLNAAVIKLIGADDAKEWKMGANQMVFDLDRVIAAVSTICFLLSIGVSYLLVSRIFDPKIAGVTAILMLLCETFWNYALSGLPQMPMLLLFSCAIYFAYRAVEDASEGRSPFAPAIVASVFFTLLALTHYLTVWIAIGYIIYAAVWLRPRGIIGAAVLVILMVAMSFTIFRNSGISGTPFGTAFLSLYSGIGGGNEDYILRTMNSDLPPLVGTSIISSVIRSTLLQTTSIVPFLGGIIVAPLFLISLLHPFRRPSIAGFRWAILIMFVVSAFGLSIYGISTDYLDPNQTHLLFAPVMTAYGLAFVSILWGKIPLVMSAPMLRNVHHIGLIVICGLPLLVNLPQKIRIGMEKKNSGGGHQFPPYYAPALNMGLSNWLTDKQICFSDQPWAVAWYADRMSIWIPPTRNEFAELESIAADLETPVSGILISPSSHGSGNAAEVAAKYKDFTSLVLDGRVFLATYPPGLSIYDRDMKIQEINKRYQYRATLVGMDMVYYSDRTLRSAGEPEDGQ